MFERGRKEVLLDVLAREDAVGPVEICVGAPLTTAEPLKLTLNRKTRHNLLICGSDEAMLNRLTDDYLVSAPLNPAARVYCVDGDSVLSGDAFSGNLPRDDVYYTDGSRNLQVRPYLATESEALAALLDGRGRNE